MVHALGKIRVAKRALPMPAAPVNVRHASLRDLPITAASEKGFIDHGMGVYEDPKNHSIWYKEGSFLKRRQDDIDKLISDYVSTID